MLEAASKAVDIDAGVIQLGAVSGRLAYALMCLSLTWGILVTAGWANRLTGGDIDPAIG